MRAFLVYYLETQEYDESMTSYFKGLLETAGANWASFAVCKSLKSMARMMQGQQRMLDGGGVLSS